MSEKMLHRYIEDLYKKIEEIKEDLQYVTKSDEMSSQAFDKRICVIETQLNNTLDCKDLKTEEYDEDDFFTAREVALIVKLQHFYDSLGEDETYEKQEFRKIFGNYIYVNED